MFNSHRARIAIDANDDCRDICKEWGVESVPAFVFMANGQIVDKYAGSDRLELMNRVLNFQKSNGIRLPQRAAPKRMSTAEAKEIARAARDRAKAEGRQTGWGVITMKSTSHDSGVCVLS